MTASKLPSAPSLPFPIFQVSQKVERYLLYDINVITWLRQAHNILGVLIGSLPQSPQQNVFLGLPLELQPEEARLLVEGCLAYIVDDLDWHTRDLESKDSAEIEAIQTDLHREGKKVAKEFEKAKHRATQNALRKLRDEKASATKGSSSISNVPTVDEEPFEDSLFGDPLARETTPTRPLPHSKNSNSDLKSWAITQTTSYPPLCLPTGSSASELPKVNPPSYALFKHLHSLGYYLAPGMRFGCQYSIYPGDPLRFHSHFLTMSYEWDEDIDLLDLLGGGRLGTGVKKGWLIGGIEEESELPEDEELYSKGRFERIDDDEAKVRTFCLEWGGM
ncbi:tRNA-splicing endonuclease subunit [Mycoblastus sanguinarius]|nr:tRNA-splicing endonuclease subunit [Mycoblastus sanguinarius]